jgi:hypothetical protein
LIIENRSVLQIGSYLTSDKTIIGNEIGVMTRLFSAKSQDKTESKIPKGIKFDNKLVDLQVTLPVKLKKLKVLGRRS